VIDGRATQSHTIVVNLLCVYTAEFDRMAQGLLTDEELRVVEQQLSDDPQATGRPAESWQERIGAHHLPLYGAGCAGVFLVGVSQECA
jgi:hypothetical protein